MRVASIKNSPKCESDVGSEPRVFPPLSQHIAPLFMTQVGRCQNFEKLDGTLDINFPKLL